MIAYSIIAELTCRVVHFFVLCREKYTREQTPQIVKSDHAMIWTFLLCKLHRRIGNKFVQLTCSSPYDNTYSIHNCLSDITCYIKLNWLYNSNIRKYAFTKHLHIFGAIISELRKQACIYIQVFLFFPERERVNFSSFLFDL